jgi:hypothetical protein
MIAGADCESYISIALSRSLDNPVWRAQWFRHAKFNTFHAHVEQLLYMNAYITIYVSRLTACTVTTA